MASLVDDHAADEDITHRNKNTKLDDDDISAKLPPDEEEPEAGSSSDEEVRDAIKIQATWVSPPDQSKIKCYPSSTLSQGHGLGPAVLASAHWAFILPLSPAVLPMCCAGRRRG